ncbi:hypothetical protein MKK69_10975 [Methylobacterium sp. J-026]|uniref:hypothetical protein n=1 Tax=Methylobacterium sp. J-026 TaxID=2836624 RepID=UPI001FB9B794|nr:hypothetical protein [Methylobacterium sp. J-026]MCJ2134572.1 hypothetical protein [Methylobacterium sp. J-026]
MIRFTAAILAGVAFLPLSAGTGLAADPPLDGYGRAPVGQSRRPVGGDVTRVPPRYSYYGEYQYPVPFGYGYAYAPVRPRGFDYGYNGPRYSWSDPAGYYGPAFGSYEW